MVTLSNYPGITLLTIQITNRPIAAHSGPCDFSNLALPLRVDADVAQLLDSKTRLLRRTSSRLCCVATQLATMLLSLAQTAVIMEDEDYGDDDCDSRCSVESSLFVKKQTGTKQKWTRDDVSHAHRPHMFLSCV